MKKELEFETFTEFCNRAKEILNEFKCEIKKGKIDIKEYQDYIYNNHNFSDSEERDVLVKEKIWEWIMSYEYEKMNINDLYSVLGRIKKGR
jgi:hypothetical protein